MKTRLGVSFEIDFAHTLRGHPKCGKPHGHTSRIIVEVQGDVKKGGSYEENMVCLLYTSPSPRDLSTSRMPSSA